MTTKIRNLGEVSYISLKENYVAVGLTDVLYPNVINGKPYDSVIYSVLVLVHHA